MNWCKEFLRRRWSLAFMLAASLAWLQPQAQAQLAITSISTTLTTQTSVNDPNLETGLITSGTNSGTFAATNNDLQIYSFTDSSGNQYVYYPTGAGNATASVIRRNTGTYTVSGDTDANNNGFSVWYANTSTASLLSAYDTNAKDVLLGNNLYRGSDNLFVNDNNNTVPNQSNIERIDFLFGSLTTTGGQTTSLGLTGSSILSSLALAVFDRGNAGATAHDPFNIALITGYDVNGNPIYTNASVPALKVLKATSANYDAVNSYGAFNYTIARDDNGEGDNLSTFDALTETASQGIAGVVFSLSDFGITGAEITGGLTVYGYSVMAPDDTTTLASLGGTSYTNSTSYPIMTGDTGTLSGGIDLVAVNGIGFAKTPIPEPSTYGAWLMGAGVALTGWQGRRRRRRGVTLPKA